MQLSTSLAHVDVILWIALCICLPWRQGSQGLGGGSLSVKSIPVMRWLSAMPLPHLATATPTINIATTAITDDHILCLDANIFTPTLDEYLVARNNPIKVTIPLKGADFSDASFGGIFLDHFDDMVLTISRGYNDSEPELFLNKTQ